jgi:hypothetical protein
MKFAQMVCATSRNVGDDIQSVAVANSLPKIDLQLDREQLNIVDNPDPTCIVMNGWFMHGDAWPPSNILRPVFVGFHVTPEARSTIAKHAQYLKQYEPIGTRDRGTAEFLNTLGIKTEVTYCMSLTLPRREKEPANGKVIRVDAYGVDVPRALRRGSIHFSHTVAGVRDATKLKYAHDLIEFYRDNARLVITTRLHCALPCIAMGIPVVFFGDPADFRTSIVRDIGGTIYSKRLHKRGVIGAIGAMLDGIDWSPRPIDVSAIRQRLIDGVEDRIRRLQEATGPVTSNSGQ